MLILLPSHPDFTYPRANDGRELHILFKEENRLSSKTENDQLTRGELRAYMVTHSIKGKKYMPRRSPFVGDTKAFASPIDSTTQFVIRRLSVAQVMTYRDRNSVVRYVTEEESGKYMTERDYPAGTMNVDLAALGLASWNIQDMNGNNIPVSEETIKTYLDPEELDFIAEKVLEINPILSSRGNQKSGTGESTPAPTGSTASGDDTPPVSQLLQTATNGTGTVSGTPVSASVSPGVVGVQASMQSIDRSTILS